MLYWLGPFCGLLQNKQTSHMQCVSSWWSLDWFGYLHELHIEMLFPFKTLADGVCHLYLFVLTDGGKGWPMVACHFRALIVLPPYDVSSHGLCFWKTDWISYHGPPIYHIYILLAMPSVETRGSENENESEQRNRTSNFLFSHCAVMSHSTTICKPVDTIQTLHESDWQIPN